MFNVPVNTAKVMLTSQVRDLHYQYTILVFFQTLDPTHWKFSRENHQSVKVFESFFWKKSADDRNPEKLDKYGISGNWTSLP